MRTMMEDVERLRDIVRFYEKQIKEAELRGIAAFDAKRFLKKKNP